MIWAHSRQVSFKILLFSFSFLFLFCFSLSSIFFLFLSLLGFKTHLTGGMGRERYYPINTHITNRDTIEDIILTYICALPSAHDRHKEEFNADGRVQHRCSQVSHVGLAASRCCAPYVTSCFRHVTPGTQTIPIGAPNQAANTRRIFFERCSDILFLLISKFSIIIFI